MVERDHIKLEQAEFLNPAIEDSVASVTLAGIIDGGVDLTDEERRSVLAADAMAIGIGVKGTLVAADIFMRNGVFRSAEVLGFEYDQTVDARDRVKINPEYEVPWIQFNLLREEHMAEVAIYKRTGRSNEEVAEEIGIEASQVEAIVSKLNEYGVFGGKKSHEIKHTYLRDYVASVDEERQGFDMPLLSNENLGLRLDRSAATISRFRTQNRALGKSSTLGRAEHQERADRIEEVLLEHPQLSASEALVLLGELGIENVNIEIVEHRRKSLIKRDLVTRKRDAANRGLSKDESDARRKSIMDILRVALRERMQAGELVVIKDLRDTVPGLSSVPNHTLVSYYHRIRKEEQVPGLRLDRTKKYKKATS